MTASAASGLVLSTTTHMAVEIDRAHCRGLRLRKALLTAGRLLDEQARIGGFIPRVFFQTLTYRDDVEWKPGHVRAYMTLLRNWAKSHGVRRFRAEWCLELTRRGRPHYHVIVWLPKHLALPKADKRGWWQHGLTQREIARRPVGYIAKYASKFTPDCMHAMPKGARSYGVCGLDDEGKRELRWWRAPVGARKELGEAADIHRAPGGYLDRKTGGFWRSPWRVLVDGGGRVFVYKITETIQ